ncbi:MAG TPA: AAA family ATPase [Chthoniobacterales bacterium]|nr:AAA family ATPase [Chthoniobacterales bacterium]
MPGISSDAFLADPTSAPADFRGADDLLPLGDRRDGLFYRYTPEIKLAVRVALAVSRPLLLLGPSGCGKSSLVFNLARLMRRRYYEFVVQARTEAQELFYRFDAIRRLGEAQASAAAGAVSAATNWRSCYPFIVPGPLWWVFDPASAARRGASIQEADSFPSPVDPGRWPDQFLEPLYRPATALTNHEPAVLLIDEIDKAEPDFPNNLLVPLGSQQFAVEETGDVISFGAGSASPATAPLIVITSNRERELPNAFIRRCIVLEIKAPTKQELATLAREAFRQFDDSANDRFIAIADKLIGLRGEERLSTAEFLDVVRAIDALKADETDWGQIILRTTWTVADTIEPQ